MARKNTMDKNIILAVGLALVMGGGVGFCAIRWVLKWGEAKCKSGW
ncbi:hypothetical protein IJH29_02110 [Candidatus Saccharibacteria bacterium]|nr:hypothetical protein [Candidatus Saccharibacteria bacterium]